MRGIFEMRKVRVVVNGEPLWVPGVSIRRGGSKLMPSRVILSARDRARSRKVKHRYRECD